MMALLFCDTLVCRRFDGVNEGQGETSKLVPYLPTVLRQHHV